jgi:prepilin-type N-terminal cleavage/methylation domain-containing protein/prepilin-type processing-associated H-X9-DG protein
MSNRLLCCEVSESRGFGQAAGPDSAAPEPGRTRKSRRHCAAAAFTLTELLVVLAVLALLASTQVPALTRTRTPARFAQCFNNLRQMGQAVMLYRAENQDAFPYGNRVLGPGTGTDSVLAPTGWPMQLLRYLGGYQTNVPPAVFVCPSEASPATGWVFPVHYQGNRLLISDVDQRSGPVTAAMVRIPSIYWAFIEKDPMSFCNITPGGLANPVLAAWNIAPGSPGYRRHGNGMTASAADGHAEYLRTPPYQPGATAPLNFLELGDCANGLNPTSTWLNNGTRVKLYCRFTYTAPDNPF